MEGKFERQSEKEVGKLMQDTGCVGQKTTEALYHIWSMTGTSIDQRTKERKLTHNDKSNNERKEIIYASEALTAPVFQYATSPRKIMSEMEDISVQKVGTREYKEKKTYEPYTSRERYYKAIA